MINERMEPDMDYLWKKFQKPEFEAESGMDFQKIKEKVTALFEEMAGQPYPVIKARGFELVLKNVRIDVNAHDWYPGFEFWDRTDRPLLGLLGKFGSQVRRGKLEHNELWNKLNAMGASNIWVDFDHSVPDWEYIMPLGFPGILERVREWRQRHLADGTLTAAAAAYFDGIEISYTAILGMLDRLHEFAVSHANGNARMEKEAECLKNLRTGAPSNTYEALQFIFLYFMFSEHVDVMQVRSLGNLDNLLPFYENDLKNGTYSESEIREFFAYFLMQYASIDNYWGHPFYLGGTLADGSSRVNRLSYLILEEFDKLSIPTPKIQLKIAENTPDAFLDVAMKMIRGGNSSLVFVGEKGITRALTGLGMTEEDARNCDICGCYEFYPRGKYNGNSTGCGHLNMLKPFELIFNNGKDLKTGYDLGVKVGPLEELETFDDFYRLYIAILFRIIDDNIAVVNDFERFLNEFNPSNVFSATIRHSLETGKDAFHNGCYYNNTTLLNAGFGSALDALAVIRELVYEKKELTLSQFAKILGENWQGNESLRKRILLAGRHYGNNDAFVDKYADMLARAIGNRINGRPNARGGMWTASMHSAKQYVTLGGKTGATPDGRLAGEEMSKNISPVQGADINGVTALILSATSMDSACFPGDFPLDVMMHPSTVSGDEGLSAWRALIRTYHARGGIAIHFNIFDVETLKAAQAHPEKYANLQIRICGWSVHFVEIPKVEQDMFIRRAERIKE